MVKAAQLHPKSGANARHINHRPVVYDATIQSVGSLDYPAQGFYGTYQIVAVGTQTPLNISLPPVFVTRADLNMGATPSAISHKLFLNIEYSWKHQDARWLPFLGIGGSVEMAQGSNYDCTCNCACSENAGSCNNCGSCGCCNTNTTKYGAISQWGTWVKGGLYFE